MCLLGLHKMNFFSFRNHEHLADLDDHSLEVRFFCSCGRYLGHIIVPEKLRRPNPVVAKLVQTFNVAASSIELHPGGRWNGMGMDSPHDDDDDDDDRGGIL